MKQSALKQVEKRVLETYKKVNPSTHKIEKSRVFRIFQEFRESLFRDRLKFPLPMFNGAEVLDFGSGTGEHDIFYARWGANVTCVEMNDLSIHRCKELFKRYELADKLKTHCCSLFDFKSDKRFDIVVSNGVLHHTNDQRLGFNRLVSYLRPGGFVFISIGNTAGAFQRNLQRMILYTLATSEKEIVTLAKFLFKEHIDRAATYGKRSTDSVIYDSYVVPKADNASGEEVLQWFNENGIHFYSSWPPLSFPFPLVDSPRRAVIDYAHKKYRGLLSLPEYFWMTANEDDQAVIERHRSDLEKMRGLTVLVSILKDVTPEFQIDWGGFEYLVRSELRPPPPNLLFERKDETSPRFSRKSSPSPLCFNGQKTSPS